MITQQELDLLLQSIESDRVEKTVSTTDMDKFGQAICAFSNDFPNYQKPGYLLIGIKDGGTRCGLTVTDQLLQTLAQIRQQGNIVPPPALSVAKFSYPDGDVAVVEVQPHFLPPVRFKGRVWIRNGPMKSLAGESEERILIEKRSSFARSFDALPCYESKLDDLNLELFALTYLPNAIAEDVLAQNHRTQIEQLASLKFYDYKAKCPTNAGILMFSKNPIYFLPGSYIQYVRFKGKDLTDEVQFEKKFSGGFVTMLRSLDDFVQAQIIRSKPISVSVLREENQINYPARAIREILMNAVMHRDYQSNAPIKFYEFDGRIEIQNPGGLFGNATPQNFPTVNDYRNPVLAEAMKNLGYVNQFNIGVRQAIKWLNDNGNPPAEFTKNEVNIFGVTIFAKTA